MRKVLISAVSVGVAAVMAVPSVAQTPGTTIKVDATVSPSKAGTKKKPRGVKLGVKVKWTSPADIEKPVVQTAKVLFPKGSLYNGSKYKKCALSAMARRGLSACPKESIMGSATSVAWADNVRTYPKITVVNGGGSEVCLWTVMTRPARVSACVPGKIKKLSGQWAYQLDLTVPQNLQMVAGVPIALESFNLTAGKKSFAPDWLATTGCPGGKWAFEVTTNFDDQTSAKYEDAIPCS